MKMTLAILAATTAIGALVTIPAIAANSRLGTESAPLAFFADAKATLGETLWLASGDHDDDDHDDDDDDDHGDHDDDDEDEDCDDDDGDEGSCAMGATPAPAGTVSPPANGLFGNGAAPRVQVN